MRYESRSGARSTHRVVIGAPEPDPSCSTNSTLRSDRKALVARRTSASAGGASAGTTEAGAAPPRGTGGGGAGAGGGGGRGVLLGPRWGNASRAPAAPRPTPPPARR